MSEGMDFMTRCYKFTWAPPALIPVLAYGLSPFSAACLKEGLVHFGSTEDQLHSVS